MNEEQRKTEVEKFMNYFVYINRPGADKLLEWLEQIGFFTAPASAKYHGAYAGGLVEHSNNVYRRLVKLTDEEDKRQGRQFPEYAVDTIAVVALLHDVCKATPTRWRRRTRSRKTAAGSRWTHTVIQIIFRWDTVKSPLSRLCASCI